jgi:uncharacterized delta-60 repeat protein
MTRARRIALLTLMAVLLAVALARAHPGALDRSFGHGGSVHLDFGLRPGVPTATQWGMNSERNGSLLVAGSSFVISRHTPEGALDGGFGDQGFVQVHFPRTRRAEVQDVVAEPDGGVLAVGYVSEACPQSDKAECPDRIALVRLTPDGSLDPSFGDGGAIVTRREGAGASVTPLPDGEILVGGRDGSGRFMLARFLSNGSLDRRFGDSGYAEQRAPQGSPRFELGSAGKIAIQSDGEAVLAVSGGTGLPERLVRYTSAGHLDRSFGHEGYVAVEGSQAERAEAAGGLAIQADGKLLTGVRVNNSPTAYQAGLIRYLPDGELDTAYGAGGIAVGPEALQVRFNVDISLQNDGKAVVGVAGFGGDNAARFNVDGAIDRSFWQDGVTRAVKSWGLYSSLAVLPSGDLVVADTDVDLSGQVLAEFTADGLPETGFGEAGIVRTVAHSSSEDQAEAMALHNGQIVLAGNSGLGFATARFTSQGRVDRSFGAQGRVTTSIGSGHAHAVAVQANGEVVVAGDGYAGQDPTSGRGLHGFVLVRYRRDGSLDPGFGGDGIVRTPIAGFAGARAVAPLRGGGLLVAGEGSAPTGATAVLARYRNDGTLDPSFGEGGLVRLRALSSARAISVQPDGRILVTGSIVRCVYKPRVTICIRRDLGIARLLSDGRLDRSFGTNGAIYFPYASGISVQLVRRHILVIGNRAGCRSRRPSRGEPRPCIGLVLLRRTMDGSPDRRFGGGDGIVLDPSIRGVMSAAIDDRGRIFVARASPKCFVVTAFRQGGSLLAGFGEHGTTRVALGIYAPKPRAIAIEGNGILVGGSGTYPTGGADFALVRLHGR